MEVRHGKNSLGIVFVLEKAINYDSKKHRWSRKADDMGLGEQESQSSIKEPKS